MTAAAGPCEKRPGMRTPPPRLRAARRLALVALVTLVTLVPFAAAPAGTATPGTAACNAPPLLAEQIACFRDAALAAGDPALCAAADDPVVRFQCLSLYAERRLDPAPCARIDAGASAAERQALQQACVAGVAIAAGDPALCEEAGIAALRDSCLMMLVTERGADRALCARIENDLLREACRTPDAD